MNFAHLTVTQAKETPLPNLMYENYEDLEVIVRQAAQDCLDPTMRQVLAVQAELIWRCKQLTERVHRLERKQEGD